MLVDKNINSAFNQARLAWSRVQEKKEAKELEPLYQLRDRYYAMKNNVKVDNKKEMLEAMADKLEANGIIVE